MQFVALKIPGAWVIELDRFTDERGFFARTWCQHEFRDHGLNPALVQASVSMNWQRGTLRGLHAQAPPYAETKLVRCTRGAAWDVLLDLRRDSPTYLEYESVLLTAENGRMAYLPEGIFHGFLTLQDQTEIFYQMSEFYHPEAQRGLRWNDPAFGIDWPEPVRVISARDRDYPDYQPDRPSPIITANDREQAPQC